MIWQISKGQHSLLVQHGCFGCVSPTLGEAIVLVRADSAFTSTTAAGLRGKRGLFLQGIVKGSN